MAQNAPLGFAQRHARLEVGDFVADAVRRLRTQPLLERTGHSGEGGGIAHLQLRKRLRTESQCV